MEDPRPKKKEESFTPFLYPIEEKILLSREFNERNCEFLSVLLSRRSSRELSRLELSDLSELLFYSNKIQTLHMNEAGFITSKRTAPSAGGRHAVDVLVSLPFKGEKRKLHYYNPLDHSLSEISVMDNALKSFFLEVNQNLPLQESCLIWFSVQMGKTTAKYKNAESLYWRDAGALLYCFQLVSHYIGLKSCPLGGLASNSFKGIFHTDKLLSGGGLLIGR